MTDPADLTALEGRLRDHVRRLAASPRVPGTAEHARAAEYVSEQFRKAGYAVREETAEEDGEVCRNLLCEPEPRDDRLALLVVGAHYDSVPGCPGADDNASAVAALLELANLLRADLQNAGGWRGAVQLAAYDLEETSQLGSRLHARDVREGGRRTLGMIALEMLGYTDARPGSQRVPPQLAGLYPDAGDFIGVVGNEASLKLLEGVVRGLKSVPGLPVEHIAVPGAGHVLADSRRSDHSSFWDAGLPALMVTDTSFLRNPHYHQTTDTPDTLDYPFLAKVTLGVYRGVLGLLSGTGRGGV